jgi:hypothetical protein
LHLKTVPEAIDLIAIYVGDVAKYVVHIKLIAGAVCALTSTTSKGSLRRLLASGAAD